MQALRVAVMAAVCVSAAAQYGAPARPDVLLVGHIRTPLSYEAALAKLDDYYQQQVGRKLAVALPLIAPQTHYETWHDMWVVFSTESGGLNVTIKRPTDAATVLAAKGWMLQLAGRMGGEIPPRYEELAPFRSAEGDVYGSRRDVSRALEASSFKLLESWQHAGLLVSPEPLVRVVLAPSGSHGVHHFTVTAESAATAKQFAVKLTASMTKPCVCAVYSEAAALDEETRKSSIEKAADVNATAAQRVYYSNLDPKQIEERLRSEPEMRKRMAAAAGWVAIKYRVDKPYLKVSIRWAELTGYTREDGKFQAERPLGASSAANVRMPSQTAQLTARTKLEGSLQPGAYRISLEGESAGGVTVPIDQRDFWFDGKTFEEL